MRQRARFARAAERELAEIAERIAQDSLSAGMRFLDCVEQAAQQLVDFPEIGAVLEWATGRSQGIRAWPIPGFQNHLILYMATRNGIKITHVVHGARNLSDILGE
jgi:plasmid stabilization system protein ParE